MRLFSREIETWPGSVRRFGIVENGFVLILSHSTIIIIKLCLKLLRHIFTLSVFLLYHLIFEHK